MNEVKNSIKARGHITRLNKCILIVALLWIATTVALLLEAQTSRQSGHQVIGTSGHLQRSNPGQAHQLI